MVDQICTTISDAMQITRDSKPKFVDPKIGAKSVYYIENTEKKAIKYVDVEKNLFQDSKYQKCDFIIESDQTVRYLELKGSDIKAGFDQLSKTIEMTKICFMSKIIQARIISSKSSDAPKLRTTNLYINLQKLTNNNFKIEKSGFTEKIK